MTEVFEQLYFHKNPKKTLTSSLSIAIIRKSIP